MLSYERQLSALRNIGYETRLVLRFRNKQFYDAPLQEIETSRQTSKMRSDLEHRTRSALNNTGRVQLWSGEIDEATSVEVRGLSVALHLSSQIIHVWHLETHPEAQKYQMSNLNFLLGTLLLASNEIQDEYRILEQDIRIDSTISPREATVLNWIRCGKTYGETAIILGISAKTVEFHMKNAMRKLGVCDRLSAVLAAVQLGIIDL